MTLAAMAAPKRRTMPAHEMSGSDHRRLNLQIRSEEKPYTLLCVRYRYGIAIYSLTHLNKGAVDTGKSERKRYRPYVFTPYIYSVLAGPIVVDGSLVDKYDYEQHMRRFNETIDGWFQ